jgi:hypothetical protein
MKKCEFLIKTTAAAAMSGWKIKLLHAHVA